MPFQIDSPSVFDTIDLFDLRRLILAALGMLTAGELLLIGPKPVPPFLVALLWRCRAAA